VQVCRDGLKRAHGDHTSALLVNMSSACLLRYNAYEQPEDLENTLDAILSVLGRPGTVPTPERAGLLESAALLHRWQANLTQDQAGLAAAAAALEEARAILRPGSADHARVTMQLGDLMYHRWRRWNADPATLDSAVDLVTSALAAMQPSGTEWARACYLLSSTLADRGWLTGHTADMLRAEQLLSKLQARHLPGFDAELAAMVAKARGLVAAYQGQAAAAAAAFTEAIELIRQQFARQVTRRQREGALVAGQGLSAQAASSPSVRSPAAPVLAIGLLAARRRTRARGANQPYAPLVTRQPALCGRLWCCPGTANPGSCRMTCAFRASPRRSGAVPALTRHCRGFAAIGWPRRPSWASPSMREGVPARRVRLARAALLPWGRLVDSGIIGCILVLWL
jgi:hypothetical protein